MWTSTLSVGSNDIIRLNKHKNLSAELASTLTVSWYNYLWYPESLLIDKRLVGQSSDRMEYAARLHSPLAWRLCFTKRRKQCGNEASHCN
jgi:hypothetical protein